MIKPRCGICGGWREDIPFCPGHGTCREPKAENHYGLYRLEWYRACKHFTRRTGVMLDIPNDRIIGEE